MRLLWSEDQAEATTGVIEDGDEFAAWYQTTWPRAVRAVAVFTGDNGLAPDIAAEAFARAFERWGLPTRPDDPTAWVIVVAINLAKKQWRRELRQRSHRADEVRSAELGAVDLDLWAAVANLPAREREAIALRYASDLTEKETARAMGITPGAAAATLHSARTKLRTLLTEHDHG